jgi:hypothetical protein
MEFELGFNPVTGKVGYGLGEGGINWLDGGLQLTNLYGSDSSKPAGDPYRRASGARERDSNGFERTNRR